jgi:hypothetical protein
MTYVCKTQNARIFIARVLFISFSFSVFSGEKYIIKKGDTLSTILHSKGYHSLWGKKGAVELTVSLNSILENQAHKIFPGQSIILPNILFDEKKSVNFETTNYIKQQENISLREPANNESKQNVSLPEQEDKAKVLDNVSIIPKSSNDIVNDSSSSQSEFYFGIGTNFSQIDATQKNNHSHGTVVSDNSFNGFVGYALEWGKFVSHLNLNFACNKYLQDSSRTFTNNKINLYGFEIKGQYKNTKSFSILGEIGSQQEAFYYAYSVTQMSLSKAAIPFFGLGFESKFYQNKNTEFNGGILIDYLMSSNTGNTKVNSGSGFKIYLSTKQLWKNFSLVPQLFYKYQKQDSAILSRNQSSYGLLIQIGSGF